MSQDARLNLFRSGSARKSGKVIQCGTTIEETLQVASSKLGEEVIELRSLAGASIDDISLLRDWDAVVAITKDVHTLNSIFSMSSSIADLREKCSGPPTSSGESSPQYLPTPSSTVIVKTPEPGDFGLKVTACISTPDATSRHDWVRLNMGGRIFATTRATLSSDPNSMLARMFESGWCSATDSTGAFLIDRSPEYFEPLLNFLRHNKLILDEGVNPQGVLEEAKFFGLSKAIDPLEILVQAEELALDGRFTRKEFLRMLSITSSSSSLRCQGMDLEGVDLSNLDLRNINFKCANLCSCNLSNSDLSYCVFERADLSKAILDGAMVECVHMPRAKLEGSSLVGCTMNSRMGTHTNLEGANLKGAVLDNSQMNGINLRLASLKGASLRSCNLRYAIMAGTDLENCNLTGCILEHANLRGSNLAGAILKDITAPLHMSQTVNVTTISVQGAQAQLSAAVIPGTGPPTGVVDQGNPPPDGGGVRGGQHQNNVSPPPL